MIFFLRIIKGLVALPQVNIQNSDTTIRHTWLETNYLKALTNSILFSHLELKFGELSVGISLPDNNLLMHHNQIVCIHTKKNLAIRKLEVSVLLGMCNK